jgi:hypothetical protein
VDDALSPDDLVPPTLFNKSGVLDSAIAAHLVKITAAYEHSDDPLAAFHSVVYTFSFARDNGVIKEHQLRLRFVVVGSRFLRQGQVHHGRIVHVSATPMTLLDGSRPPSVGSFFGVYFGGDLPAFHENVEASCPAGVRSALGALFERLLSDPVQVPEDELAFADMCRLQRYASDCGGEALTALREPLVKRSRRAKIGGSDALEGGKRIVLYVKDLSSATAGEPASPSDAVWTIRRQVALQLGLGSTLTSLLPSLWVRPDSILLGDDGVVESDLDKGSEESQESERTEESAEDEDTEASNNGAGKSRTPPQKAADCKQQ